MSPTEKLMKIHELTERALRNPTPLATLMQISHIAGKGDSDHEYHNPATSVFIAMAVVGGHYEKTCWTFNEVYPENHVPHQEQNCRDNPPPLVIAMVAVDQLKLTKRLA